MFTASMATTQAVGVRVAVGGRRLAVITLQCLLCTARTACFTCFALQHKKKQNTASQKEAQVGEAQHSDVAGPGRTLTRTRIWVKSTIKVMPTKRKYQQMPQSPWVQCTVLKYGHGIALWSATA